ncbi:sodium:solute symporter [Cellvibrio zantedeschiae]|uniref:Sodium:solute symporter n=1 Tax=Cellvibrio zantedeschiae TaxID=1237077 RepID=A0ABQ3BB66_9GAMM|nr:sodium:solute symporter family protein [Cellvibrio zantedeschiae]GGY87810.1 sodium:solute symporter [Cellvibrio zantedeschiae]
MNLPLLDILIVIAFICSTVCVGFWVSARASKDINSYFLGGNKLKWYMLGLSNASGMFDISGTMWLVYLLFVYGLSSVYIPWLWPTFNQIFLMVFLATWLRRSGVMTGAEWIIFRFGDDRGARLSNIIVVAFALVGVIGFLAYGFIGIGKFASVFFPWKLSDDPHMNDVYYGLGMTAITTFYIIKGGMFSVVFTEVFQFIVTTIASIGVGIIAMNSVSPEMLAAVVPAGWDSLAINWHVNVDWAGRFDAANQKIAADGYSLFGIFFMLMLFKGVLLSLAGPAPNYDMQRVLSTQSPRDAAKMSGFVTVVLMFPRYMLIAGLTVLALAFFMTDLKAMGPNVDFEQILPFVLKNYIPSGLLGLLIAGLLAAFMSNFAATVNAAPAYVVNDIYKRYINPNAHPKRYVYLSYVVSLIFIVTGVALGFYIPSVNTVLQWIVSGLYGGYTASNVLKWYWWRFNAYGYFYGMAVGIVLALALAIPEANIAVAHGLNLFGLQLEKVDFIYAFPWLFVVCLITCVVASLVTAPTDMAILKKFYLKVRPWGFWKPVHDACLQDHPALQKNTNFLRDMVNVVVGIVWQTSLVAAPIFLVIHYYTEFALCMGVAALGTLFLWKNWYQHLQDYPADVPNELLVGTNDAHLIKKS